MRDPHEPVIPGEYIHPKEGHGGISMPIGVSGDLEDKHDPVETGEPATDSVPHVTFEVQPKADPNDVAHHIKDSFIAGLQQRLAEAEAKIKSMLEGNKAEPTIDEQLAETPNADSNPETENQ